MKLKTIKEQSASTQASGGAKYGTISQLSMAKAIQVMADRRQQMMRRLDGVPSSQGLQELILRSLNFESIEALWQSIDRLKAHALLASKILAKLIERKRQDEVLDSTKSIAFINDYLDAHGVVSTPMNNPAYTNDKRLSTSVIANALQRVGLYINTLGPGHVSPELIHALMHMPSSEVIPSEVTLSRESNTWSITQQISVLYEEAGIAARYVDSIVPLNSLEDPDVIPPELERQMVDVAYANIGVIGCFFLLDNLLNFIMGSAPQNILLSEVYSKTPIAQNTTRRVTLEGIAMYLHSLLQTVPLLAKATVDHTNATIKDFTGHEWRLNKQVVDNYDEFVKPLENPRYDKIITELHQAINDPQLKPYDNYPYMLFEEGLILSGNAVLMYMLKRADLVVPEVGVITDLTGMLAPDIRTMITSASIGDHNYFMNQSNYIRTASSYEALLYQIISVISPSIISNISSESVRRANQAIDSNLIPLIGVVATIPVPAFATAVSMENEAAYAAGTTPLTERNKLQLSEPDIIFKYFGYQAFTKALGVPARITVHDETMAAHIRKMIGINWNALYPQELVEGPTDYIGMPGSNQLHQNLGFLGRLLGRSSSYMKYDVKDSAFLKLLATALSSSHALIKLKNPVDSPSQITTSEVQGMSVIQGYGTPYGMSYQDLMDKCYAYDLSHAKLIADIKLYGMFITDDYTHVLVPLRRIPLPMLTSVIRSTFGPMQAEIPVAEPAPGLFIEIKDRTVFVRLPSLKHFTLGSVDNISHDTRSATSLFSVHPTGYMLDAVNYMNEFIKVISSGFKLPSVKGWAYAMDSTFIRYIWYADFSVEDKSSAAISDEAAIQTKAQKEMIETIESKAVALAASAANETSDPIILKAPNTDSGHDKHTSQANGKDQSSIKKKKQHNNKKDLKIDPLKEDVNQDDDDAEND